MRAQIRRFHSPDVHDLESFAPDDPTDVGVLLQMIIGPLGAPGEESFDVMVCTTKWLSRAVRVGPVVGRHHLFVDHWDFREISEVLSELVNREEAEDWSTLGLRLSRLGHWEFEDYRPRVRLDAEYETRWLPHPDTRIARVSDSVHAL